MAANIRAMVLMISGSRESDMMLFLRGLRGQVLIAACPHTYFVKESPAARARQGQLVVQVQSHLIFTRNSSIGDEGVSTAVHSPHIATCNEEVTRVLTAWRAY